MNTTQNKWKQQVFELSKHTESKNAALVSAYQVIDKIEKTHEAETTQLKERIAELEANAKEHKRLEAELCEILHPMDDSPENPSFCDLVAYVEKDLSSLSKQLDHSRARSWAKTTEIVNLKSELQELKSGVVKKA